MAHYQTIATCEQCKGKSGKRVFRGIQVSIWKKYDLCDDEKCIVHKQRDHFQCIKKANIFELRVPQKVDIIRTGGHVEVWDMMYFKVGGFTDHKYIHAVVYRHNGSSALAQSPVLRSAAFSGALKGDAKYGGASSNTATTSTTASTASTLHSAQKSLRTYANLDPLTIQNKTLELCELVSIGNNKENSMINEIVLSIGEPKKIRSTFDKYFVGITEHSDDTLRIFAKQLAAIFLKHVWTL